jgi:hypothetical protein
MTVTTKPACCVISGVPEINPETLSDNPSGKLPWVRENVYGSKPPLALSCTERYSHPRGVPAQTEIHTQITRLSPQSSRRNRSFTPNFGQMGVPLPD